MNDPPPAVFDASVFVDALVSAGPEGQAARAAVRGVALLPAPAIFGAEALSAVRALRHREAISAARAEAAREAIRTVRLRSYPFGLFIDRVWELRDNLSVYDGWYVALAERLDVPLVTAERRLVGAPGPQCLVRHVTDEAVS